MPDYRTLVVAPKNDLALVDDEVQQVVNQLGEAGTVKQLRGEQCNIHGLLEILKQSFDIVWFSTHGDEKGVYLNDGILSASEITALVRSAGTRFVFLNTCSSRAVAVSIYDELRIPIAATLRKVPDRSAFITATLLSRNIALGLPFRVAFDRSIPGQNSTYIFLPEEGEVSQMPLMDKPTSGEGGDLNRLTRSVQRLEILVQGDRDYGVSGLVPDVATLKQTVDGMAKSVTIVASQVEALNKRTVFLERLLWILIAITALLFIAFVVFISRGGGV